jgi:hypothetical protein
MRAGQYILYSVRLLRGYLRGVWHVAYDRWRNQKKLFGRVIIFFNKEIKYENYIVYKNIS